MIDPIGDWRHWWKLNSNQVAAFWAALGGIIVAGAPVFLWWLNMLLTPLPFWQRALVGGAVSAVTFGSYVYARVRPQPRLVEKRDG
jgi:hypothetical protein